MVERIDKKIGRKGELTAYVGPMFGGKTASLIDRVDEESYSDHNWIVVKPSIDTRYDQEHLVTHSGRRLEAYNINSDCPEDIIHLINTLREQGTHVDGVGIDEVQFFKLGEPNVTVEVVEKLLESGLSVAVAGLPTDFADRGFGAVPVLMAKAEDLQQRTARCQYHPDNNGGKRCGARATKTQRIINGQPAHENDSVVLIGGHDSYEARCFQHHEVKRD